MFPFLKSIALALAFILAGVSPDFHSPATAFSRNSKYEIACTMCDACENPCQPVYSPPLLSPPPPAASPPPPPPPSQPTSNCPPPPSPKSYHYSPPPPTQPGYLYPPPSGGGGFYLPPPDTGYFPMPPPPNPIVPYFPFYFHNPPPMQGNSAATQFRVKHPVVGLVVGLVIWCVCGFF